MKILAIKQNCTFSRHAWTEGHVHFVFISIRMEILDKSLTSSDGWREARCFMSLWSDMYTNWQSGHRNMQGPVVKWSRKRVRLSLSFSHVGHLWNIKRIDILSCLEKAANTWCLTPKDWEWPYGQYSCDCPPCAKFQKLPVFIISTLNLNCTCTTE